MKSRTTFLFGVFQALTQTFSPLKLCIKKQIRSKNKQVEVKFVCYFDLHRERKVGVLERYVHKLFNTQNG